MDRKISYNWLKENVKLNVGAVEFAKEFSLKSMSVERIEEVKPKFKKVVTAKILEIAKHPNADKLQLATVDNGKDKLTVVCGANNIVVGQIVPLAVVGASVVDPENGGEVVLEKAKIRGVESNGMLCASDELGLGNDHSGILILPAGTPVGKDLNDVIKLDDYLLDVEITTNRPDAAGIVGLAHEAAAVFNKPTTQQLAEPDMNLVDEKSLSVEVKESQLCPRYQAVVMSGVEIKPSPLWLQLRLMQAGIRPINNLVDITNYVLLEHAQPMHVFDYDKLQGQKIIVRNAKDGESILALDGNTYKLAKDNLVIADAKNPIAVAGVMGGQDSAVDQNTKTIIFECANFAPVQVRKTARSLNLYSESSSLFEKGLHPEGTLVAMLKALKLAQELAMAKTSSPIIDIYSQTYKPSQISFDVANIKRLLGVEIKPAEVKNILEKLGFEVSGEQVLKVTVPWWRANDVKFDYDFVEEVARIYGYHNLPTQLPSSEIPITVQDSVLIWEDKIKDVLTGAGLTEAYNYSIVSQKIIDVSLSDKKEALKINNPLNEEMVYLRIDLEPIILQNVSANINNFDQFGLFELSNVYRLQKTNDLPQELPWLCGAVVGQQNNFLYVKGIIDLLFEKLGIRNYIFSEVKSGQQFWLAGAVMSLVVSGQEVGRFGLVNTKIVQSFGIEKEVAMFSLNAEMLAALSTPLKIFTPIPTFPSSQRDLAIVVEQKIKWRAIQDAVKGVDKLVSKVDYQSTYTDEKIGADKKSLAFRITFQADRTLTSVEVDKTVEKIIENLKELFNATLR